MKRQVGVESIIQTSSDEKEGDAYSIRQSLMEWYKINCRDLPWRQTGDPYKIWVSEMMLQQTQVNTVIPYYLRFIDTFPNVKHLAEADLQDILKLWEGLGYYARARNFHKAAKQVMEEHGGVIPDTWDAFKALPGVGDYIASAVLSIAFAKPYPVVDGNVKRVFSRLFEVKEPINQSSSYAIFKSIGNELLDRNDPGTFNQAVMELGALICKPANPDCLNCPVIAFCQSYKHQAVDRYPVKIKKQPVPHYNIAIGVVLDNKRVLIVKRPESGMLGGLWEFPGGKMLKNESPEDACIRKIKEKLNLKVKTISKLTRVKHGYTHFKITADIFLCKKVSGKVALNGPADHKRVRLEELNKFPFHKSNLKFIPQLIKFVGNQNA